jgi:DNA-binding MarR family transcriptional regulator
VKELAEALSIHPSTATRLCDRLVAKRLVRRSPARDSRREIVVSLQSRGRNLVEKVTTVRRREIAAIVARVPTELWNPAVIALTAFAEAAGEVPDQAWSLGWS